MVSVQKRQFRRLRKYLWLRGYRFFRANRIRVGTMAILTALLLTGVVTLAFGQGWLVAGAGHYMVMPGDTVEEIAARYDIPATLLVQVNRLADPTALRTGQILAIPAHLAEAEPVADVYIVQAGESLSSIAAKLGTSVDALLAQNSLINPNQLQIGQALQISGTASHTNAAAPVVAEVDIAPTVEHYYYVKYGDSLLGIANYFGVPTGLLLESNQLAEESALHVGDKLLIPDRSVHDVPGLGPLIWPITSNAVIRGYFYGHRAIDILMPIGSPVVAVADGVVESAGWHAYGYGNVIMIDHGDGTKTLYAHLNSVNVAAGQTVSQGELIGETGHTGNSTHPHLHFELYIAKQAVYPCLFLEGGCG